jgi:hypothetical protein
VLVVSSDIPALKPEMVDWLVNTCMETKDELYYGVCPKNVMESRFPGSKRTYTHLKDMDVCGADINITHVRMATEHLDMWESLIGSRKSPLKQASLIGYGTLFALFTRRLTLEDAVQRVCDRIGIQGRAIVWPYAEPCMDVDKPNQLELMQEDLAKQQEQLAVKPKRVVKRTVKKTATSKPATKTVRRSSSRPKKDIVAEAKSKLKAEK